MQAEGRGYELIDAGDERRLEKFGQVLVDRPAPAAIGPQRDRDAWRTADARYAVDPIEGRGRWTVSGQVPDPWTVEVGSLSLELRLADGGQVGLFPEQVLGWPWLEAQVRERAVDRTPEVLHLFAHTGGATLVAAAAGASVVHVDASRPAVAWARANAVRSGLGARPVRWIVDDAGAFVAREVRRRRRYDGLALDPPSYGHGPRGRTWRLVDDLDALLDACRPLLAAGAFVLLTAHTPGEDGDRLASRLAVLGRSPGAPTERGDLSLVARSGVRLHLGAWARIGSTR